MTTATNAYDALYTNLKNQFTVIYNGAECTVGDFMLMKANKRSESALPIATTHTKTVSMSSIVEYVNDKLTVKRAPAKNQTMRKFPFRTSISSMLSATAACALILSCGAFAVSGNVSTNLPTADAKDNHYEATVSPDNMPEEDNIAYDVVEK